MFSVLWLSQCLSGVFGNGKTSHSPKLFEFTSVDCCFEFCMQIWYEISWILLYCFVHVSGIFWLNKYCFCILVYGNRFAPENHKHDKLYYRLVCFTE